MGHTTNSVRRAAALDGIHPGKHAGANRVEAEAWARTTTILPAAALSISAR